MGLKATVESLEAVPEAARSFYVASADGKSFVLDAENVPDVSKLQSALREEREAIQTARNKLKEFDGVDIAAYRAWAERNETDEETRLFSAGKKDELRARWTGKMQEAHAKEIDKINRDHVAALDKVQKQAAKYERRVLENWLRAATIEVEGFHKPATRDAVREGLAVFTLDEDGNAVKRREDGTVVTGKDGKNPYSPKEWLEEQRADSPHWFAAAGSGTGAEQTPGRASVNGAGQKTMLRADFDRLPDAQKHAFVRKEKGIVVDR